VFNPRWRCSSRTTAAFDSPWGSTINLDA